MKSRDWGFYYLTKNSLLLLYMALYRVRVINYSRVWDHKQFIVAANHTSFLDPPLLGGIFPMPLSFMAKQELFDGVVLRCLLNNLNVLPVNRGSGDIGALKTALKILRTGQNLIVFPEGTRSRDGQLQPAKSGLGLLAARSKVPVLPVYIEGTYAAWPPGRTRPKLEGEIIVSFGTPLHIDFSERDTYNKQEMKDFAQTVMIEIARVKNGLPGKYQNNQEIIL